MSTVTVNKRGADRIRSGHLWIYRSDVVQADEGAGGSVVVVRDQKRNFVGQAFFSNSSQIALRFLSQTEEPIDREWWRRRIIDAAGETRSYRFKHKRIPTRLHRGRSVVLDNRRSLRRRSGVADSFARLRCHQVIARSIAGGRIRPARNHRTQRCTGSSA